MKRFIFILICSCGVSLSLIAQHQVNNFLDEMGIAQITTATYNPQSDFLFVTNHRAEDVIWSRVVYRVIDMRYKQNYQLYFPTSSDSINCRSLFKVIVDAIIDGMPVYENRANQVRPDFKKQIQKMLLPTICFIYDPAKDTPENPNYMNVAESDDMLFHYDSIQDKLSFHFFPYEVFVRNQLKYVIQEVIFFDRHYSRLYSKIMAIAPLHSDKIEVKEGDNINYTQAMSQSLLFWIPFDALRPYLQKQFVITDRNDTKRVTYDEFFQKKLYSSYLLGDGNIYNRLITDYIKTPEEAKKEQDRIAEELLNFEQDLWEY
ncbi:MAG: gliding motility protein GldN [Paludibacteraceae bacterium]|nr:gliding motility protein GldN [Paludibacteraceae bacterium]